MVYCPLSLISTFDAGGEIASFMSASTVCGVGSTIVAEGACGCAILGTARATFLSMCGGAVDRGTFRSDFGAGMGPAHIGAGRLGPFRPRFSRASIEKQHDGRMP